MTTCSKARWECERFHQLAAGAQTLMPSSGPSVKVSCMHISMVVPTTMVVCGAPWSATVHCGIDLQCSWAENLLTQYDGCGDLSW